MRILFIALFLFVASVSLQAQDRGFIGDTLSNTTYWVQRTLPSGSGSSFQIDIYNKGSGEIMVCQSASDTTAAVAHVSKWWTVESGAVLPLPNRVSNTIWIKVVSGSAVVRIFKY